MAEIGTGTVNRDAKLRADAVANAKVKKTIKKGESVTIHEAKTDSTGKLWYYLTVDDSRGRGLDARLRRHDREQKISASDSEQHGGSESAADRRETAVSDRDERRNQEVIATGEDEPRGQSAPNDGRQGACAAQKGTKVNIYEQTTDTKGNVWYQAQAQNGEKVGYLRDYVVTLDKGASTTGSSASTAAAAEDLQDREVIGKATTNRAANVREEPLANATVVRQLGNGMELQILAKYAGVKEETWYEVVTASGKTHGFVRDYVVYVTKLDKNAPTLTYEK
ncbi:MAG: SH3 domain-containing protein [Christensenellales bacterium]